MNVFSRFFYNLFKLCYPFTIYGKENIPEGSAVLVCNHFSFIDCLYFYDASKGDCKILAKKELFDHKVVGKIIKDFGAIPINRENPNINSLLTCVKALKSGKKLLIFPEGTRNKTKTSELQEIKGGSAVFAVKAKKPIVPIMINKKSRIFRRAHILIGEPFELTEFYDKKIDEQVINDMDRIIKEKMIAVQNDLFKLLEDKKKKRK